VTNLGAMKAKGLKVSKEWSTTSVTFSGHSRSAQLINFVKEKMFDTCEMTVSRQCRKHSRKGKKQLATKCH